MLEYFVDRIQAHPGIDNAVLEYLCKPWDRYMYGNGEQAATCLGFFREMQVPVQGLLTFPGYEMPRLSGWWGRMLNHAGRVDLTAMTQEQIASSAVLLAVPRETYGAARELLARFGFRNIYTCCWERNQYLRDICMDFFEENRL